MKKRKSRFYKPRFFAVVVLSFDFCGCFEAFLAVVFVYSASLFYVVYFAFARGNYGFTSVLFGMGQLSEESVAGKIAEQLSRLLFDAPHILRMEKEFEPLRKAALEAFREIYPNREHFLKKR